MESILQTKFYSVMKTIYTYNMLVFKHW